MADKKPLNASARLGSEPFDVERLLRHEMSVEPSSEFLPRLRERMVTAARPPLWRRLVLPVGALAAAASAAIVIASVLPSRVQVPPAPVRPSLAGARPIAAIDVPSAASLPIAAPQPGSAPVVRMAVASHAATDGVPVIVDEQQRGALAVLIAVIRNGTITEESFAATKPVASGTIRGQIKAVEVSPVTVTPIDRQDLVREQPSER